HEQDSSGSTTEDQELVINFKVTDADGDFVDGSFNVIIKDDMGHGTTHAIAVDEDNSVTFNTSADGTNNSVKVVATDRLTYGDVTVHADGSITYTPKPDYSGSDSFTYTTTEDGVEVRTTVTVTVNPVADKPDFDSGSGAVDTFEDVAIALGLK